MRQLISNILIWVGMPAILAGLFIPLFTGPQESLYKYIFAVGAGLNLAGRLMVEYTGRNVRVKRLLRIEVWAALFFGVAAYFMFTDPNPRSWIAFVLAGGAILAYTSLMIPRAQRKEGKEGQK